MNIKQLAIFLMMTVLSADTKLVFGWSCDPSTASTFNTLMTELATNSYNSWYINGWVNGTKDRRCVFLYQDVTTSHEYSSRSVLMQAAKYGNLSAIKDIWNSAINMPSAFLYYNNIWYSSQNIGAAMAAERDQDGFGIIDHCIMNKICRMNDRTILQLNDLNINIPYLPGSSATLTPPSNTVAALGAEQSAVTFGKSITVTNLLPMLKSQALVQTKSAFTQFWLSPLYKDGTFSELPLLSPQLTQLNSALKQNSIVNISFSLAPNGTGCNGTMVVSLPGANEPIFSYTFENIPNSSSKPVPSYAMLSGLNITYQTKRMKAGKVLGAGLAGFNIARS